MSFLLYTRLSVWDIYKLCLHANNYVLLLLVYSTEPAGAHKFMAGNNGDSQAYSYGVYSHEVYPYGVVQEYDTSSARNQNKTKTRDEVISDDKKRDSRNVERRKIIRQQTSQRRDTLTDSLAIAKLIIEGHSKNKDFEKKASERRRVIKHCTSPLRSLTGEKQRSMSFFQELQTGCSVILPSADHQKSVEKSKARRRTIKDHSAGKRRPSLTEEIADAKKVIVDSERKYEISPAQVKEVRNTISHFNNNTVIHPCYKCSATQEYDTMESS